STIFIGNSVVGRTRGCSSTLRIRHIRRGKRSRVVRSDDAAQKAAWQANKLTRRRQAAANEKILAGNGFDGGADKRSARRRHARESTDVRTRSGHGLDRSLSWHSGRRRASRRAG